METTKAAKVAEACSLFKKARAWFGEDLIGHPAFSAKVFGDMQVRLVMFVHGFRVKSVHGLNQWKRSASISQNRCEI